MLLAANLSAMLLQVGVIIEQPKRWLRVGIHLFSEINSL
jgi:hypothetical protein